MKNTRSISVIAGCILILTETSALAQSRDMINLGVGLGLGVLLNEMSRGGPRNPGDQKIGRVPEGRERSREPRGKSQAQIAAEREQRQRQMEEAVDVQNRLKTLNFYAGNADGKTGPQTRAAISAFQRSLGQAPTGTLSNEQKNMLIASTTVAPTSAPPASALQPLTASAPTLAPLTNNSPVSPNDPFANATSMLPQPGNLSAEAANANSDGPTNDISILGVSPKMAADDAFTKLVSARDVEWCNRSLSAIVCNSNEGSYSDEVIVGITAPANGSRIHSVVRTTRFTAPVPRAAVEGKVQENYPTLVAAPGGVLATGTNCAQTMEQFRPNEFGALKTWITSGAAPTPAVSSLSSNCTSYHEVSMPAGETISGFTIALFSGEPLQTPVTNAHAEASPPVTSAAPDIRF